MSIDSEDAGNDKDTKNHLVKRVDIYARKYCGRDTRIPETC